MEVTVVATYAGQALVAATANGIAAVLLGDSESELRTELEQRFPGVALEHANPETRRAAARIAAAIDAGAADTGATLELDIGGTPFQRAVWQELRRIPPGGTATYAEIAERVGRPEAVRAVAQACAANRHAVVIPCHRVVRSDGSLSGYRWGVERKRLLLDREQRLLHAAVIPSRVGRI